MLKHGISKVFISMCIMLLLATSAFAELEKLTLKRGIASKKVIIKAMSLGGYCGRCLNIQLTNTTKKALTIQVDPGMVFLPDDTAYQNLVLWGSEQVEVAPGESKDIFVETFCGKSYGRYPRANVNYTLQSKASDTNMVKTLAFARSNRLTPFLVQHAVWLFTNHHSLNSVYKVDRPKESELLINYLAKLLKQEVPTYYNVVALNNSPDEEVIDKEKARMIVPAKWGNGDYKHMYVTIYKANGDIYRKIDGDQIIDKDGVTMNIEFEPHRDLKGTYTIQAKDNNNKVWFEKTVVVDFDYRPF